MQVQIIDDVDPDDGVNCWMLEFEYIMPECKMRYVVTEPRAYSFDQWNEFCLGDRVLLNFYQGNGEGSMTHEGDRIVFTSSTSGAGGDTIAEFSVDKHLVVGPLMFALHGMSVGGSWRAE